MLIKTNTDFILREIFGKHILFPVRSNSISADPILLNDVAAYIWKLTNNGKSRHEVLKEVALHYSLKDASSEIIYVKKFLNNMINMKLLDE